MKYIIGETLKNARKSAGFSVSDIVSFLQDNGIETSAKTIYGWESNFAYPSVHVFLLLCEKYKISDVVGTFLHNSVEK